jgi:hypothetical protein
LVKWRGDVVIFKIDPVSTAEARKVDESVDAVFIDENREYVVVRFLLPRNDGVHRMEFRLGITREDGQYIRSWRLLQDIKNQVVGEHRCAIEVYPAESRTTDTINMYHLWVYQEGHGPPVGLFPPKANTSKP